MWYVILAFWLSQGNPTVSSFDYDEETEVSADNSHTTNGEAGTPRPPRPPRI
ncbi:hypothetical protein [Sphingobacterium sp. Mn56C]|uniref:hypothetical protein n=1 Tax=Sphingobacterium sp. Mn56C TaxID=3395261 RepID=UPI003BF61DCB